jgi:glutamine synthetase type III
MKNKKEVKAKKHRGRPSVFEDQDVADRRIKIYISHFYEKLPYWELTKKYEVSESTVRKAIEWVNDNYIKIPNKAIIQGAIFSIEERIKKLTALLEKEIKNEEPSIRNVKELNSELRSDEVELNKLKNIYQEKYSLEIEGGNSIKQILKVLSDKK